MSNPGGRLSLGRRPATAADAQPPPTGARRRKVRSPDPVRGGSPEGPGRSRQAGDVIGSMNRRAYFYLATWLASAQAAAAEDFVRGWSAHFQATSIGDMHGSFSSPYEGPRSLPPHLERRVSLTTTAFLAASLGRH